MLVGRMAVAAASEVVVPDFVNPDFVDPALAAM
jgi:hypothetical protein